MIANQDARRNLTSKQAIYYRGMRYNLEKNLKGGQEGNNNAKKNESDKMTDSFIEI